MPKDSDLVAWWTHFFFLKFYLLIFGFVLGLCLLAYGVSLVVTGGGDFLLGSGGFLIAVASC